MKKLEIACFNLESALIAQESGADRVELCADILLVALRQVSKLFKKPKPI